MRTVNADRTVALSMFFFAFVLGTVAIFTHDVVPAILAASALVSAAILGK